MGKFEDAGSEFLMPEYKTPEEIEWNVQEIRISTGFGHIAGKWWGSKDVQPILALHGWQDNAGTFDRLIPLLPKDLSVLALDFPGHGLSSRFPDGMAYHMIDFIHVIDIVMREYKWEKVSLLGHSLGSILSYTFASLFPERVHMVIGIDALKPGLVKDHEMFELFKGRVKNTLIADHRNQIKSEPPAYTYEELLERLFEGTHGSVSKETGHCLLRRNIKKSETYPGKYYFSRDNRVKWGFKIEQPHQVTLELAKSINMPYLAIKASQFVYYGGRRSHDEIIKVLEQNPNFYHHEVDSTHHVHLTEPEKVATIIKEFIHKYRNNKSKL